MKNKFFVAFFISGFAVVFLSMLVLNSKKQHSYNASAQILPLTPYPTKPVSKYVYITYTCRNDSTNASYVLTNPNRCRSGAEWLKDANNSCYQKTSGTCAGTTGSMSNCVESYKYSPECAVKPVTVTIWPTRYLTPTPSKCIPPPSCLFTEPRCLMPEPIGGWCKLTPTPAVSIYPTRYPTCNPTAGVISCPQPPPNCKYVGGDGCTTCGKLYCITPGYGSTYPTGGFTPYPTERVSTIYPYPTGSR